MSVLAGEHNFEQVPQKNSHHRRNCVPSRGTAKKMMISGSGLREEVQLRRNDLPEVLRKAASEACEATQEEVRGAVECALFIQLYSTKSWRISGRLPLLLRRSVDNPTRQRSPRQYVSSIWSFLTFVLKPVQ